MRLLAHGCLAAGFALSVAASAVAQESKSAALAKQVVSALNAAKLDSVAAKAPSAPDAFVAALSFPGQLLVVSASYAAPSLMDDRIAKKDYREIYIDLNSASKPQTKVFIQDGGADGLKADRSGDQAFDAYEAAGKRTAFDGDWKKQHLSKEDYLKTFGDADERYSVMLTALLAEIKKTS